MPKKHIVMTAKGLKLDMDALKKSQPNASRIIAGRGKEKPQPKGNKTKSILVNNSKPRIKATIPATHPKESHFLPNKVSAPVEEAVNDSTPVSDAAISTSETPEQAAEERIQKFEHSYKKEKKS